MIVGHIGGAGSPYEIQKSLRFRSGASAYLSRTPVSAGNQRTFTWSGWLKRGVLGNVPMELFCVQQTASFQHGLMLDFDTLRFLCLDVSTFNIDLKTTAVFRDPTSWYHVVVSVDTTDATASNRVKLFVNGVQITSLATATYPAQNYVTRINEASIHNIARNPYPSEYFDGYLSEINFIDGQALDASYFGEVSAETGAWIPKKYTGTYGTNGFYLPFNDGSNLTNLAADRSGNGNNWTANNISLTAGAAYDWMDDTPTNNFAVLNPLADSAAFSGRTITEANLRLARTSGDGFATSTLLLPASGKFYFESTMTTAVDLTVCGLFEAASTSTSIDVIRSASFGNGVRVSSAVVASFSPTSGDIFGFACNCDTGIVNVFHNGVLVYTSTPLAIQGTRPGAYTANTAVNHMNFGQRPFAYTPPAGFKALCTKNLPAPSILNPKKHFDVVLATGANIKSTAEAVFPGNFLEWIKDRGNANNHQLIDSVRGTSAVLQSNTTAAETTYSAPSGSSVGWTWKAGGAPVTNNDGSIQSQVSANPQAGFSIVTYTGTGANATVGHGLGVAPKMIISKSRNNANADAGFWDVYHARLTSAAYFLKLNTTDAQTSAPTVWNSTAPTSSVYSVGTASGTNAGSSATYVAYCFAEIHGFSKIGSYTGNGSADGPFVWCGFRPKWVMIKRTDVADDWEIRDVARDTYNVQTSRLRANQSAAEVTTAGDFDYVSNGFKVRNNNSAYNTLNGTYIFIAFAEAPFQFANAR